MKRNEVDQKIDKVGIYAYMQFLKEELISTKASGNFLQFFKLISFLKAGRAKLVACDELLLEFQKSLYPVTFAPQKRIERVILGTNLEKSLLDFADIQKNLEGSRSLAITFKNKGYTQELENELEVLRRQLMRTTINSIKSRFILITGPEHKLYFVNQLVFALIYPLLCNLNILKPDMTENFTTALKNYNAFQALKCFNYDAALGYIIKSPECEKRTKFILRKNRENLKKLYASEDFIKKIFNELITIWKDEHKQYHEETNQFSLLTIVQAIISGQHDFFVAFKKIVLEELDIKISGKFS